MDRTSEIRSMYDAFNVRDAEVVLAAVTPDVDWDNGWEGGRVEGRDQLREYWERQWAEIDPTVEPEEVSERPDGGLEVVVHQVVRGLDGQTLSDDRVRHVYWFREDLISRMDIEH